MTDEASRDSRDLFAKWALARIPKILTLQDRNPHSPTFGSFDRDHWQYKTSDFPSGMAQSMVLALALAWDTRLDGNPFWRSGAVRSWVEAGIRYAAASSRADGSCDDYFPFERAAGAAAFSLLTCIDASAIIGLQSPWLDRFLLRRAGWLARHRESGRLSNHEAMICLGLALMGRRTEDDTWAARSRERLERVLSWQDPEGWFQEYEGCDPGYLTLTLASLARLQDLTPSPRLESALRRATTFALQLVHPDGSFGGEYGSRNTYNYFPHGFELVGRWMPEALEANDRFARGLRRGLGPCYDDDHVVGHHTWSYLLAWKAFRPSRRGVSHRPAGRTVLPNAGLLIDRRQDTEIFLSTAKGGVFKMFRDGRLVASDTQVSLLVGRRPRNVVAHNVGAHEVLLEDDRIVVKGTMSVAKHQVMTAGKSMLLRAVMLTFGRMAPDLVRRLLQRHLILGRAEAPFRFRRTLTWTGDRWLVRDEVEADDWAEVTAAGVGSQQTSIHVVMSRVYHEGQLQEWHDLTERVRGLAPGERLVLERSF